MSDQRNYFLGSFPPCGGRTGRGVSFERSQGFVLPTVLIFLLIFTLLGLSALSLSQLELRMSHNTRDHLAQLQIAEAGLQIAEQKLLANAIFECLISSQRKPWESEHFCQFSFNKVIGHYIVEQLADNPTVCIADLTLLKTAHFYRITSWIEQDKNYPIILQTTFITPGNPCKEGCKQVMVGRSSWREV